jgi:hypothetical protein
MRMHKQLSWMPRASLPVRLMVTLAVLPCVFATPVQAHGPWYTANYTVAVACDSATVFSGYSPSRHDLQNPLFGVRRNALVYVYQYDDYAATIACGRANPCKMLFRCLNRIVIPR